MLPLIVTYHDVFGSYPLEDCPFLKAMKRTGSEVEGKLRGNWGESWEGKLSWGCNIKEGNKLKTAVNNKRGACF